MIGAITGSFNEGKIPTPRWSRWHVSSVANLLTRAQKIEGIVPQYVVGAVAVKIAVSTSPAPVFQTD
jgi:hypothetical protein